jgi:DNA modification methylase
LTSQVDLTKSDKNYLFYGDNLEILRRHIRDKTIDLIYLDPPFKSNQVYNILYAEQNGTSAAAQIKAFEDTWHWDMVAASAFQEVVTIGGKVSQAMQAFRTFLGQNDMMAYLAMMAPRLLELKRVLKDSGSIYLHCDPTASHYLKMLMDSIFSPENFRNEIIWRRTGAHGAQQSYGPIHDTILFYTKSNDYYFKVIKHPYMMGHVESRYTKDEKTGKMKFTTGGNILTGSGATKGESGMPWRGFDPSAKGRHWAIPGYLTEQMPQSFTKLGVLAKLDALYEASLIEIKEGAEWPTPVRYLEAEDGHPLQDIWAYQPYTEGTVYGMDEGIDHDVAWLGTTDPERLGYQTQKPLGILERIIHTSCPENGVVLDPFCGCGTTILAAEKLKRRWFGIDITHLAIALIKHRLSFFVKSDTYHVVGEPTSLPDAEALARDDPYQFQYWALGLVGARPTDEKKGADKGIDGRLYFFLDKKTSKTEQIIFSVKSGHVNASQVRDLRGVVEREKAAIGVFITFQEPTAPMRSEAASAGFYIASELGSKKYPRIQIMTIEGLLNGRKIDYPAAAEAFNITFKKPGKADTMKTQGLLKQTTLSKHD